MGLFDVFKGKKKEDDEPINLDLRVDDLEVNDLLDYDLDTWKVEKTYKNRYDAVETREWQIKSGDKTIYLELEEDDERELSVSVDVERNEVEHIEEAVTAMKDMSDDPIVPETVVYKGIEYYFEDQGIGVCDGEEYIYLEYESDSEECITLEQWDENDFSVSHCKYIDEFELTNILKGAK